VKVGVWCAVCTRRIAGPVFFKETMNCEKYVQIIFGKFFSELTEEERLYGCFQQDSATTHTTRMPMQALSDVFGDIIISSHIWPARSSELSNCDFFLPGLFEGQSLHQETPNGKTKRKYS
jgi:hypothetical protein